MEGKRSSVAGGGASSFVDKVLESQETCSWAAVRRECLVCWRYFLSVVKRCVGMDIVQDRPEIRPGG